MKKTFLNYFTRKIFFALLLLSKVAFAQSDSTTLKVLNEVVVNATRATVKTGMAFTNVTKKELEKQNLGQDIPILLNQLTSVVTTSDAGAGVGYTGIRIRGSDPTRVNVTINGIPYNDSESQGVFWVNMPDFSSSVSSIQLQRGVGTSTNGAGAFGGTLNVNTLQYQKEAFGEVNASVGSFNTLKTNIISSTGLINNKFVLDMRLSKITSDGFVDRASSDLKSYYLTGGYYGKQNFVRLNVFGGKEVTYQSWYGIPESLAKNDKVGFEDFINRNYYDEGLKNNMWAAGRKYNWYNYDNQVDDYEQDHVQLISSFKVGQNWRFNPTLHYTYGRGFYEQYREDDSFTDYNLNNVIIGLDTITNTNLIRRKWLNNHFYGTVWSLDYEGSGKLKGSFGGGWNRYDGDHYGEIIWAQYASNSDIRYHYYDNNGLKTDFNIYGKGFYQFNEKLNAYLDLQYRNVGLKMTGTADALQSINSNNTYSFFNPKLGFNYNLNTVSSFFASFAVGNKEPSRQDLVDHLNYTIYNGVNGIQSKPLAENLMDYEAGYRFLKENTQIEVNGYFMNYKNQLVLTGAINNVGEAIRVNVAESYRAGIELQIAQNVGEKFKLMGNLTLSQNKIGTFTETVASYDGESPDEINNFKKADISFSPNIIAGGILSYFPISNLEIALLPKFVGKQFLDNTSDASRKLDAYFVNNLRINYSIKTGWAKNLSISALVNNVFNTKYESNGYTYSYLYYGKITENFVYPQAGINFLTALKIRI